MHRKRYALSLLTSVLLLTSACGWHLRGTENPHQSSSESALEEQTKTQQTAAISPVTEPKSGGAEAELTPDSAETKETGEGYRLLMRERNHDLAIALNRVAWENRITFSSTGSTILVIEREKLEKRPLTVTETGVAAQYQLILTITFSRQQADGSLISAPQQIVSWRSYDFDPKLILAKVQEEEALLIEMREELARRMLLLLQKAK